MNENEIDADRATEYRMKGMSRLMDEKKPRKLDKNYALKNGQCFIYGKQPCPEN